MFLEPLAILRFWLLEPGSANFVNFGSLMVAAKSTKSSKLKCMKK